MVQTLDSAAADAVAKLEHVSNMLRARGFSDNADQIKEGVDVIIAAVSSAMCSLQAEEIVIPGGPGLSAARAESITSGYEAEMIPEIAHLSSTPITQTETGVKQTPPEHPSTPPASTMVSQTPASTAGPTTLPTNQQATTTGMAPGLVRVPDREPQRQLETQGDGEAGALFLQGNFNLPNPLHFVTSQIHEGPIVEVLVSQIQYRATIVFQHSLHAGNFLRRHEETKARTGFSLYGKSYTLTPGPLIPWDDQTRAMGYPFRERRRLTFARAGLFTSKLTPDQFKADMVALVGKENVELAWVFNAGNATVIFRSTGVARSVYQFFRKEGNGTGISARYVDADVTYSSDPCEKPLVYSTQLQEWQVAPRPQQPAQPAQRRSRPSRRRGGVRNPQETV